MFDSSDLIEAKSSIRRIESRFFGLLLSQLILLPPPSLSTFLGTWLIGIVRLNQF